MRSIVRPVDIPMRTQFLTATSAGRAMRRQALDSRPFHEALAHDAEAAKPFFAKITDDTMLKKLPMMKDIANVAVFLASGHASMITGVTIDVTAVTTGALNYKMPSIAFVKRT